MLASVLINVFSKVSILAFKVLSPSLPHKKWKCILLLGSYSLFNIQVQEDSLTHPNYLELYNSYITMETSGVMWQK